MSERQSYIDAAQRRLAEVERQMLQMSDSTQLQGTELLQKIQEIRLIHQRTRNRLMELQENMSEDWEQLRRDVEHWLHQLDVSLANARTVSDISRVHQPGRKMAG